MCDLSGVFDAIDAANDADPNLIDSGPRARVEGQRAVEHVRALSDDPSDALLIAARAHHLRRWEVPRATYPEGRAGYLKWRRDQKRRHAADVANLLADHGYGADVIVRTQELLERTQLRTDPETQTLEDAACLVFLEVQYDATAQRLGDEATVTVLQRTLAKMSEAAIARAGSIALSPKGRELLSRAISAP